MKCPKCKVELKRVKRGDVVIDTCDLCYGIWLDKGELEKVSSTKEANLEKTKNVINSLLNTDSTVIQEKSYNCPVCDKEMQKVQFNTKEKIIVDICSACEGKWFDSGEMIAVSDAVAKIGAGSAQKKDNVSLLPSIMAVLLILAIAAALIMWTIGYFK